MRRYRRKNKRKEIIFSLVGLMFLLSAGYAAYSTSFLVSGKGTIVDKSRMIQAWASNSNEDFHTDFYKANIISATFLDSNAIPSNAVEVWDVSVDKDGGVMAYVVESSSETGKYDLYIGANDGVIANVDSSYLFQNFTGIKFIEFGDNFDTSNVISMHCMFHLCSNLLTLNLSGFNTSNVTDMNQMFNMCTKLANIVGLESFSTHNVIDMYAMFHGCANLIELNVSSFITKNVTSISKMFYGCKKITTLDLRNFDISKVTDLQWLFANCENLKSVDLSSFNTNNVTNMASMFQDCENLTHLNLCSFNTSKVTSMWQMFYNTPKITKITVGPNWSTINANTSNMFINSGVSSVTKDECL